MANENNLIQNRDLSPELRKESARNAGIASGKKRRERKQMKETLEMMLQGAMPLWAAEELDQYEIKRRGKTVQDAIIAKQLIAAMQGDRLAAEFVRDTVGDKEPEKMQLGGASVTFAFEEGDAGDDLSG